MNANLSSKRVDVECEEEVEVSTMMDALKKWAGNSGKTVEMWA